jgi:hypothetical protein
MPYLSHGCVGVRETADAVAELIDVGAVKGFFVPEWCFLVHMAGGDDFEAGCATRVVAAALVKLAASAMAMK